MIPIQKKAIPIQKKAVWRQKEAISGPFFVKFTLF